MTHARPQPEATPPIRQAAMTFLVHAARLIAARRVLDTAQAMADRGNLDAPAQTQADLAAHFLASQGSPADKTRAAHWLARDSA